MSGTYRDLKVWQLSMDVVSRIYELTGRFPQHELYGLTGQLRRAAVSIPSNIAEGKGRTTRKELNQFLSHSRGSLHEVETQMLIAARLGYVNEQEMQEVMGMLMEVARMLSGLMTFAAGA